MALLPNIIAYRKLDEGSGTNANDEVGSDDGTLTSATWVAGKLDDCVDFSGTTQYITLTNASNTTLSSSAWTISYWMNKDANGTSIFASIIANDNSTGTRQFAMGINTSGQFYFERNGVQIVSGGTTFSNTTWYHIVVTYDGTNLKSYVNGNGSADTSTAMSALLSTANNLYFGRRQYSGSEKYYNGRIDEVGIRNVVLSGTDISNLYNGGTGLTYPFGELSNRSLLLMGVGT